MKMMDMLLEGHQDPQTGVIAMPYGFGQGLLSATSSFLNTFIWQFIMQSQKGEGIISDYDFIETSDDVLLYVRTEEDYDHFLSRIADDFKDFG